MQWHLLASDSYFRWLGPTIAAIMFLAAAYLAARLTQARRGGRAFRWQAALACTSAAVASTFVAPTLFALTVPRNAHSSAPVLAGPRVHLDAGRAAASLPDPGGAGVDGFIAFLQANDQGERWLLATPRAQNAQELIVDGVSVAAFGGYTGSTPAITVARTRQLIASAQLRFVLVEHNRGHTTAANRADDWVVHTCQPVPHQLVPKATQRLFTASHASLYDCQPTQTLKHSA